MVRSAGTWWSGRTTASMLIYEKTDNLPGRDDANVLTDMLAKYKNTISIVLIGLAFLLGQLTTPRADDQLRAKFENEREVQNRIIRQKNMQIISLQGERRMIKERAIQDSIHFADLLEAKDKRIKALTIKINAVDYHRFNSNQLDSVRALLLAR
jgi:hypothetical protein